MIGLRGLAVESGAPLVPIDALSDWDKLESEQRDLIGTLGIDTVAGDDADVTELLRAATSCALAAAAIGPDDVDVLVVIPGRAPEFLVASEATRLQEALGLRRAVTFSVGDLGCASVGAALLTARSLLISTPSWQHVLIVHESVPAGGARYRYPVTVNGIGAMAAVVGHTDRMVVRDIGLESDGRFWDLFAIDYQDRLAAEWVERCRDMKEYSFRLAIESRNRFRDQTAAVLGRSSRTRADVTRFIMQNLSESAFHFYEDAFGCSFASSCRENLRRHGHLGPIDVLLNLNTSAATGELAPGDVALLFSNSPSAAWSTVVIEA